MTDHVGQVVKSLRKQANITQAQLADDVGVSQHTVSRVESGARQPSQSVLNAIMQVLGYPAPRGRTAQACRLAIIEKTVNEAKTRKEAS